MTFLRRPTLAGDMDMNISRSSMLAGGMGIHSTCVYEGRVWGDERSYNAYNACFLRPCVGFLGRRDGRPGRDVYS
jgi:hypothetical protein